MSEIELNCGDLKKVIEKAPGDAPIILEHSSGFRYKVTRAAVWGTNTDQPFLLMRIENSE